MLLAAESVIDQHGLEGATVRRIAARARLAPATVYRRFPDKDALMAAVFQHASEQNVEELAKPVDAEQLRPIGIVNFARNWISAMIGGFRTRTGLIRAAMQYSQAHQGLPFVQRQMELERQGFRKVVSIFLLWRDQIRHPDPEQAVAYAMITVAMTLRELILFNMAPMFDKLVPVGDDHLREELPRAFLRYLGVEEKT